MATYPPAWYALWVVVATCGVALVLAQFFNTCRQRGRSPSSERPPCLRCWCGRGRSSKVEHGIVGRHRGPSPLDTIPVQNARVVGKGWAGAKTPISPA